MSKRYEIELSGAARRQLRRLAPEIKRRIAFKIDSLSTNPRPKGYTQLETKDRRYRIRVGDYRIIYKIFDDIVLILVLDIGHRRQVYRNL